MRALESALDALGADVHAAIEEIRVPVLVIDREGIVRYANDAFLARFGDARGRHFRAILAPESIEIARANFARKIVGSVAATDDVLHAFDRHGRPMPVEVSTVALHDEETVVGVFGIVNPLDLEQPIGRNDGVRLTPRQAETLRHLAAGCTTRQMAELMFISEGTVRSHVRDVLRRLDAHSRLEAVVTARTLGLV